MDTATSTAHRIDFFHFFETSILFRLAAVSIPAIISFTKTVKKLPDSEAESQYHKVKLWQPNNT